MKPAPQADPTRFLLCVSVRIIVVLKRLINRLALLGEKLWTVFGDVQTVLEPDTKLTIDHDGWLVAKTHPRLNRRLIPANEVRPFVTIHSNPMTSSMRETGHFVIRPEACVNNYFSRRCVYNFAGRTDFGSSKPGILRSLLEVPDFALAWRGLTEYKRPRDIGLIAVNTAAAIHQNYVAFL